MNADSLAAQIGVQLGSGSPSSTPAAPAGPTPFVPDLEILARIGGGSYGEVWLARSVTGALRAVKVIRRADFSNERPYEREFRGIVQFEPVSRLHPDVISILHVGRDDAAAFFFYVMELADNAVEESPGSDPAPTPGGNEPGRCALPVPNTGVVPNYVPRTLALDLKTRGRLPIADVLRLGIQLADALGHLHRHGLVHRDVKPSNVIFIRDRAKLADIGLVAGKDETRSFVGTEGYVPPEGHGSERADLFSLGRLLYEAAAGKDRCDFPELPLDLDQWAPKEREALLELNEVMVRACAEDPTDRHANAAELAADLNLILGGRSIRRAYGIERRLRRARQVSMIAIAVLGLATGIVWFQDHARRNAEVRASEEAVLRHRAEAAEHESRRQLYTALLEQARANRLSRELGQRVSTLNAIGRAAAITNSAELRREAFAALALPDLRFEGELLFEPEEISRTVDPTFERFAVSRGRGPVEIRAVSDRRLLAALQPSTNHEAHLLTWSADGRYLAFKRDYETAGFRADLEVWDLTTTNRIMLEQDAVTANALSFHPYRPQILAGRASGALCVWDLESTQEVRRVQLASNPVSAQFSPDGSSFAVAHYLSEGGSAVLVHDIASGALLSTNYFTNWIVRVIWHPQGRWIAAPDYSGNVRLLDLESGSERILGRHKAAAVEATFTPEGDFMITGGWERELICWDLRSMERAFTIGINSSTARFGADGRRCAIYGPDRALFYEFQPPTSHLSFQEELGRWLAYGAFSADGQWVAASGNDFMAVWNVKKPGPAAMVPTYGDRLPLFVSTSTGTDLYAYWEDTLRRWKISQDSSSPAPRLEPVPIYTPRWLRGMSVASNELVMTSMDGARFMPPGNTDPENVRFMERAGGWGRASPDGKWLAVRMPATELVRIYRLPDLERIAWLTNQAKVWTSAFSPRGDEFTVATSVGLEFYSTATWQRTRELPIRCERQTTLFYAPDGETFWFGSDARTSALRDTRTLGVLLPLPAGHLPLALSPDGRQLVMSIDLQRVQVWDMEDVRIRFSELGLEWPTWHR